MTATNLNCIDKAGRTPLMVAVLNGSNNFIKKILKFEIDINIQDNQGYSALMLAAKINNAEAAQLLLQNPDTQTELTNSAKQGNKKETALLIAIQAGSLEVARILVADPRVDINKVDENGYDCICRAVLFNRLEIARALITNPTKELNIANTPSAQKSSLHIAVSAGLIDFVIFLLSLPNIKINALNSRKQTPIMLAIKKNRTDVALLLLADPRIDLSIKDNNGDTVWDIAKKHENNSIQMALETLENVGKSKNKKNLISGVHPKKCTIQ